MSIESRCSQYGTVFGHWSICEFLGQGSEGKSAVFRLNHCESKEVFSALKVISLIEKRGSAQSLNAYQKREYEAARDRCTEIAQQEVLLMNSFQGNTNIVDYLDHTVVDWTDESGFGRDLLIRMELLRDLRSIMSRGRIFSEREVLKIGRDICSALVLCHRNNILHRDIKPENIFFSKSKSWKLGDFGISKILSSAPISTASTSVGTPQYAAPEQFFGQQDCRIDIYSLGLVLYELSNQNRLPFATSSYILPDDVQRRFSGEPLPPPSNASPELADIILKACAFDPEDRFQTALEFLSALRQLSSKCANSGNSTASYSTYSTPRKIPNERQTYATIAASPTELKQSSFSKSKTESQMNGRRNIHRSRKDRTILPILLSVLLILFALIVASLFIYPSLSGRKEKGIVETSVSEEVAVFTNSSTIGVEEEKDTTSTIDTIPAFSNTSESEIPTQYSEEPPATVATQPNSPTQIIGYIVNAEGGLNVRKSPSVTSSSVKRIYDGDKVIILEQINSDGIQWGRISDGWICMNYVSLDSNLRQTTDSSGQAKTVVGVVNPAAGEINIRSGPGTSYNSIGRLPGGQSVTIYEQQNTNGSYWGRIGTGWVCMDYIILTNDRVSSQSLKTSLVFSVEGQRQEVPATYQHNSGYSIAIPDEGWYFNHTQDVDSWENASIHQAKLYVHRPNGLSREDTITIFVQNNREYNFENVAELYTSYVRAYGYSTDMSSHCSFFCTEDNWLIAYVCPSYALEGLGQLMNEMSESFSSN